MRESTYGAAGQSRGDHLRADEAFRNLLRQVTARLQTDSANIWDRYWLLTARAALGEVTDLEPELKQLALDIRSQHLQVQTWAWLRVAVIYATIGDYDRALNELRTVLNSKAYSAGFIAAHPALESLKGDSRFQALLEKYDTGS